MLPPLLCADVDNVFIETYARMRTAINHLQTLGVKDVVVAGFSLGSRLATAHVARGQVDGVSVPVIDIYGDNDTSAADTAAARLAVYNSGTGLDYTQTTLACLASLNCCQLEGLKSDDSMPLEINISAWVQAVVPDAALDTTSSSSGNSTLNIYLTMIILLLPLLRVVKVRD